MRYLAGRFAVAAVTAGAVAAGLPPLAMLALAAVVFYGLNRLEAGRDAV